MLIIIIDACSLSIIMHSHTVIILHRIVFIVAFINTSSFILLYGICIWFEGYQTTIKPSVKHIIEDKAAKNFEF